MPIQSYAIVSGHNGTPVNWETLVDADSQPFPPIAALGTYESGVTVKRADGTITTDGLPTIKWKVQHLLFAQYKKIRTDYCGGGLSGLVTITSKTYDDGDYDTFNAVLNIEALFRPDNEWGAIPTFELEFIRLEVI